MLGIAVVVWKPRPIIRRRHLDRYGGGILEMVRRCPAKRVRDDGACRVRRSDKNTKRTLAWFKFERWRVASCGWLGSSWQCGQAPGASLGPGASTFGRRPQPPGLPAFEPGPNVGLVQDLRKQGNTRRCQGVSWSPAFRRSSPVSRLKAGLQQVVRIQRAGVTCI